MAKAACAAFLGAVFALCTSPAAAQSTVRVSVSSDGIEGNEGSSAPSISADGRFVAFWTDATTLVDKLPWPDREVLVHDRYTGRTERISVANDGTPAQSGRSVDPAISADGRFVAFSSNAANLIPYPYPGHYPPNLVYIRDRHNAVTSLVSSPITGGVEGLSYAPSISRDGRYVAFLSTAQNLVAGYTGGTAYVRDLQAAVTTQIDIDREGHGSDRSYALALSADGRFAAFLSSSSALVSDDTNGSPDVFVRDLSAGTTTRVSIASDGTQANWGAEGTVSISADGRYVAFLSKATNLVAGPPNSPRQLVYVHDRQTRDHQLRQRRQRSRNATRGQRAAVDQRRRPVRRVHVVVVEPGER